LGTTTIEAVLVDLEKIKIYGRAKTINKQKNYGITVTERLRYSKKHGVENLNKIVTKVVEKLIEKLKEKTSTKEIEKIVLAGNTAMTYFYLNEDPKIYEKEKPNYREVKRKYGKILLPCIGEFIGGDITAGLVALNFDKFDKNKALIDLGTNGEVCVLNKDYKVVLAASASAGPAFEGGGFRYGMPAMDGAIYEFSLKNGYKTIGGKKPRGICGTGMLDIITELYENGILLPNGELTSFKKTENGKEYFITKKISISESEIKYFIDSKAAIFATLQTLLQELEMDFKDLDVLYIAGGFGKFNIRKACKIGLLPKVKEYKYVGNSSLKGAKLCLIEKNLKRAEKIANSTTVVDLVNSKKFYENYLAARFIPHTDERIFE